MMLRWVMGFLLCIAMSVGGVGFALVLPVSNNTAEVHALPTFSTQPPSTTPLTAQTSDWAEADLYSNISQTLTTINSVYYTGEGSDGILQLEYLDSNRHRNARILTAGAGGDILLDGRIAFGGQATSLYNAYGGTVGTSVTFRMKLAAGFAFAPIAEQYVMKDKDGQPVMDEDNQQKMTQKMQSWVTGVHRTTGVANVTRDPNTNVATTTYSRDAVSLMRDINASSPSSPNYDAATGYQFKYEFKDKKAGLEGYREGAGIYRFIFRICKVINGQSTSEILDVFFDMVVKYPDVKFPSIINGQGRTWFTTDVKSIADGGIISLLPSSLDSIPGASGASIVAVNSTPPNGGTKKKFNEFLPSFLTASYGRLNPNSLNDTRMAINVALKDGETPVAGKYDLTYYVQYSTVNIDTVGDAIINGGAHSVSQTYAEMSVTIEIVEPQPDNTLWIVIAGLAILGGAGAAWYYINRFTFALQSREIRRRREEQEARRRVAEEKYFVSAPATNT